MSSRVTCNYSKPETLQQCCCLLVEVRVAAPFAYSDLYMPLAPSGITSIKGMHIWVQAVKKVHVNANCASIAGVVGGIAFLLLAVAVALAVLHRHKLGSYFHTNAHLADKELPQLNTQDVNDHSASGQGSLLTDCMLQRSSCTQQGCLISPAFWLPSSGPYPVQHEQLMALSCVGVSSDSSQMGPQC